MVSPEIEESWKKLLAEEFRKEYFQKLKSFLLEEKKQHTVFPPGKFIFNAFDQTPVDKLKAVIIGQDPYHGVGQAHGLCFSVNDGIKFPPSLANVFKELKSDVGCEVPFSGNLTPWAQQGVFLLNAVLTVRQGQAGSHQNKGWENFTDAVIKKISDNKENVVFLLWGNYARAKAELIDKNKHLVLEAAHPSPLARGAFFGSKHFSKTNEYLKAKNIKEINWCL